MAPIKKVLLVFSFISFCILVPSCDLHPESSDIPGTYYAKIRQNADDNNILSEKLVLFRDGTFTQDIMIKNNPNVFSAKGKWDYSQEAGCTGFDDNILQVIGLEGGGFIPDFYFHRDHTAICMPTQKILGKIRLIGGNYLTYKKAE